MSAAAKPPKKAPDGTAPFGPAEFKAVTGVSADTLARLETYHRLLRKWQPAINLVSAGSLTESWRRHFLDSAQLHPLLPAGARRLADFGSGAGFPGLVLAILGAPDVHLIESDGRKCAFLWEVARETATRVEIHRARIEALAPLAADVITARAAAPLARLCEWGERHGAADATLLLLKGQDVEDELTEAAKSWRLDVQRWPSRSDPSGVILSVKGLRRV